ncbi:MAG: hypothetical protein A3C00_01465 [Candidatus Jacksonbacteria bacterium RIFCSPHIGHO2_02_FULL_44_25]|nr:MAG: hypothetical protein UW40_C0001G0031 [Parcubacteria group bacterium GW2011_GWF2_44_17]OGY70637.1 MAG: hypothetical protein A3E05_02665 [Candidatus Jacksonbacteria bacterium RIFCSPHIGHO2_12_FULL_44_12]OGY70638.1 MAG: hypothetical protein A3E05_02670 [Candidatus Jacksonbacteria bacterium RIFCSPHIGHO2_12_FULL_44_12]OGY71842.1 MAG: hypothetical protein A3C00_01465 [Candidatus Jacksonbacteria bacterium RIFCSPHIGHO2_02_FULL_44_25]
MVRQVLKRDAVLEGQITSLLSVIQPMGNWFVHQMNLIHARRECVWLALEENVEIIQYVKADLFVIYLPDNQKVVATLRPTTTPHHPPIFGTLSDGF